ncbi:relaxase/mobilization nuclease domain-containing protein [Variovorax sp. RT4R15]|uniref:relaxase/mobilization nuclease domain-containing protein n=1 Tax=Variovorax sp. RT4R15 TaxID=3443737 RepID=UPI003F45C667
MPKHIVTLPRSAGMELDIVSYGRRGPGGTLRLNSEQVEQVKRTVSRVPEVMVKVSGGARDCGGAKAHLKYIGRHGKLDLETDDGRSVLGRDVADDLAADWQLDLCRSQYKPKPAEGEKDTRAKLVHNIVLSMPAGTPPEKVLNAARIFARENFALQYRYAMVLHTDQAHPHVHLVVKCEHETTPGKRLYIRKDTLRQWREQFAALMREQGVPANATPRQIRGQVKGARKDPIHHRLRAVRAFQNLPDSQRAARRPPLGSTFMRRKVEAVGKAPQAGRLPPEPGRAGLAATRAQIEVDWTETAETLRRQGHEALARQVAQFTGSMPPVRTELERIAAGLLEALKARGRNPEPDLQDRSQNRSR